jgi:hypothetical protein
MSVQKNGFRIVKRECWLNKVLLGSEKPNVGPTKAFYDWKRGLLARQRGLKIGKPQCCFVKVEHGGLSALAGSVSERLRLPFPLPNQESCRFGGWPTFPFQGRSKLLKSEQFAALVDDESQAPRQNPHIYPLEGRPLPGIRLAPDNRHGADALQGKDVKNH